MVVCANASPAQRGVVERSQVACGVDAVYRLEVAVNHHSPVTLLSDEDRQWLLEDMSDAHVRCGGGGRGCTSAAQELRKRKAAGTQRDNPWQARAATLPSKVAQASGLKITCASSCGRRSVADDKRLAIEVDTHAASTTATKIDASFSPVQDDLTDLSDGM